MHAYTPFSQPYNPRDPFNPDGPVAIVSEAGRVTAMRHGTCFVYAEVDGVKSAPVRIEVEQRETTGISVSRRRHTMSADTTVTINASVRPAAASNRRVEWRITGSTDANGKAANFLTIQDDERFLGIIRALPVTPGSDIRYPGTVTLEARHGSFTAEAVITVTAGPSATVRRGRTANYSVLGAPSNARVEWALENLDRDGNIIPQEDIDDSAKPEITANFAGSQSGSRFRVTARQEGPARLKATIKVPEFDNEGNETENTVVVREQTWNLESVVPINRLGFRIDPDGSNEAVRRITLGVPAAGTKGQPATLEVELLRPNDATRLDFEWSARKDKQGNDIVLVDCEPVKNEDGTNGWNGRITVTALNPGSTRITGTNFNGRRRINISVRVFLFPTTDQIMIRSNSLTLELGKNANVRGKVSAKNADKRLSYELADGVPVSEGSPILANDVVRLDTRRGRLQTVGVGTTEVTVRAVGGAFKTITVTVTPRRGSPSPSPT
jgi:hypothetical protein